MKDTALASPDDWATWRSFLQMRRALDRVLERELQASSEISIADFGILVSIFGAPAKRLRPVEIGDLLGWEKSRISHQVSRMQSRGLLAREDCDTDARGKWVVMTPAGHRAILGAMRGHSAALRRHFFDALTDDETDMLNRLSLRVRESTAKELE